MKKILERVCYATAGLIGIGILVTGFLAYFVISIDLATRHHFDGLGRELEPSPWFIRFIFGQDRDWPGWSWWLFDFVWFWGGIAIAYSFVKLGEKKRTARLIDLNGDSGNGNDRTGRRRAH